MKFDGSRLALFAAALGVAAITSGAALSQGSYPSKPIRILVGFAPGGPSDIISRVVGAKMGEIMGLNAIVTGAVTAYSEAEEGTDFIVVTPSGEARVAAGADRKPRRSARFQRGPAYYWR